MKVRELFTSFVPDADLALLPDISITGIEEDSRRIKPGDLFVARTGTKTDGAKYLADAAARGAAAALVEQKSADCPIPQIVVAEPGKLISPLAQRLFGDPSRSLKVLAVTGTNGKTTTVCLVRHILAKHGMKCGIIGTVELDEIEKAGGSLRCCVGEIY
jgi:UDP-N-acetylmuramoyl-L-alanyl-D-glutamate--2,6-diaminopimelate ligase